MVGRLGADMQLHDFGAPGALARPGDGFVDDDPRQPGRQFGVAAELADRAPGLQVGFLQRVFGFGVVAQDAARGAVQQLVVAPHQQHEGALVAGPDAARQFGVADVVLLRCDGGLHVGSRFSVICDIRGRHCPWRSRIVRLMQK